MSVRTKGNGAAVVRKDFYRTFASAEDAGRFSGLYDEAVADALRRFEDGGVAGMALTLESIEDYMLWCSAWRSWRAETIRTRRTHLLGWLTLLPARPLSTLTSRDMTLAMRSLRSRPGNRRRYGLDQPGLCGDTVNKYLQSLRDFIGWARKVRRSLPDYIELDSIPPVRISGKLPDNRFPPRVRVHHEFFRIVKRLDAAAPHVAAVIYGMLLFCRRPSQLFRLRWGDVHMPVKPRKGRKANRALTDGKLNFGPCKGGCETSPPVPYGSKKHRLLLRCLDFWQRVYGARAGRKRPPADEFVFCTRHGASRAGHGWTTSSYDQELARRCKALGIDDFKSYDARRSVISWLQSTPGISPAAIQAFAGWLRITTQEAYGARSSNDGLPALEAMEGLTLGLPGMPGLAVVAGFADAGRGGSGGGGAAPESGGAEACGDLFDDIML